MTELPPLSELSYGELLEEIRKEEVHLKELEEALTGSQTQIDELKKALIEEYQTIDIERHRDREKRILRLREEIEVKREQFRRVGADIEARTETIREREASRAFYLRRSRDRLVSLTDREAARDVAETLKRSISRLKGWQTRKTELQDTLREELRQLGRTVGGYLRWQIEEETLARRITELEESLAFWTKTREDIERDIKAEQEHLEKKREELKKRRVLHRIKLRLYNVIGTPSTPKGMFQTWWVVDGVMDPDTGMIDRSWHLTLEEIEISKFHMIGYYKGMAKWLGPSGIEQAFFDETGGVVAPNLRGTYKTKRTGETYTKNVPREFISRAAGLTLEEIVVAISSEEPTPTDDIKGVFFERAMIISASGEIKWDEIRNRWAWRPSESKIEEIREELGLG